MGALKAPLCLTYLCPAVRAALEDVAGPGCCGEDGFEFLDRLRGDQRCREVPVIVLTARDLSDADRLELERVVSSVVEKSSGRGDRLAGEIRRLLAAREAADTGGE